MEMQISKLFKLTAPVLASALIAACGGSGGSGGSGGGGGDTIEGLYEAAENEVVIYYKRDEAHSRAVDTDAYEGYGLHLWNGNGCESTDLAAMGLPDGGTAWDEPAQATGFSETYGAYYVIKYEPAPPHNCINFIMHKGDDRPFGGGDMSFLLDEMDESKGLFGFHGSSELYYFPIEERPVAIDGQKAHWLDKGTIAWMDVANAASYELRYDPENGIALNSETKEVTGGTVVSLSEGAISDAAKARFPHLKDMPAASIEVDDAVLKQILKSQIVVFAYNADGEVIAATQVQKPGVIDVAYVEADGEGKGGAINEELGAVLNGSEVTFKLWAPTAQNVRVFLYDDDLSAYSTAPSLQMEEDANGIWSVTQDGVVGKFYKYEVTVYHPTTKRVETVMVTDPYSLSLSENSTHSQVVDLEDPALYPAGWGENRPTLEHDVDHVLYESHLRDFSVSDSLGSVSYNGKYLALTESERESVTHLQELKDAGLTTLHILPAFDIATVNEDPDMQVDITDTVGKLCGIKPSASICGSASDGDVIEDILYGYDPSTGDAQALMNDIRDLDSFNWGYDPFHYTVPEGSYATNAHGTTRILEFREMVQATHDMGLKLVMDVVYNHTNASGVNDKSVLDKIVPGYYHRLNVNTGGVETSTCCDNTATENLMMGKLMIDSLVTWSEHYNVDGYRFDLMGHQPKDLMVDALVAVRDIDEDTLFYGEGWDFGEVSNNARFTQATQWEMAGTEIGTFSDRLRDAVRGGSPFDSQDGIRQTQGFANASTLNELNEDLAGDDLDKFNAGLLHGQDLIRVGMAGNLREFILLDSLGRTKRGQDVDYNGAPAGYTLNPSENISYVSKHDNQTLWDNNAYKAAANTSPADRARMQSVALSTVMYGQGIPFIHMGSEILRSKSMQRDSYDSGDWFNRVRFDYSDNNWNVGLPREDKDGENWDLIKRIIADATNEPATRDIELTKEQFIEMLAIRNSSKLFRLQTEAEVKARVDFRNVGQDQVANLIVMSIDNGTGAGEDLDENVDAIVVVINATAQTQDFEIEGATGFELHEVQQISADSVVQGASFASETFSVPALTSAVFVMPRDGARSAGLPVDMSNKDLSEIPPFGNTPFYLRGVQGMWDNQLPLTFDSNGKYKVTFNYDGNGLFAEYGVVVATEGWETKFEGCDGDAELTLESGVTTCNSEVGGTSNFAANFTEAGIYHFVFDASNTDNPVVSVTFEEGAASCENLPPATGGSLDPHYVRGDLSDWGPNDTYQMLYKGDDADGMEIYQAVFDYSGSIQFKIADGSDNWGSQFFVANSDGSPMGIEAELPYQVTRGDGGQSNNTISLGSGTWSFKMTIDPSLESGLVGDFIVQECSQ
ncbi:pullulanase-type alpha-1,6-glucosidase [Aliagarivorans taiwanensis]|uniref:pullulanase-type alpha-1,6-glucosidase n=1 Tax=Aliagarivorans taiwanensis TaxID=561966 RepID=UPI0004043EE8|nr:pullulanase-type alpha-1,6-glucosidase [Aliagarivorans taiwanensis]